MNYYSLPPVESLGKFFPRFEQIPASEITPFLLRGYDFFWSYFESEQRPYLDSYYSNFWSSYPLFDDKVATIMFGGALLEALPHWDVVITRNTISVVRNDQLSPASRERSERLIQEIRKTIDKSFEALMDHIDTDLPTLEKLLPRGRTPFLEGALTLFHSETELQWVNSSLSLSDVSSRFYPMENLFYRPAFPGVYYDALLLLGRCSDTESMALSILRRGAVEYLLSGDRMALVGALQDALRSNSSIVQLSENTISRHLLDLTRGVESKNDGFFASGL